MEQSFSSGLRLVRAVGYLKVEIITYFVIAFLVVVAKILEGFYSEIPLEFIIIILPIALFGIASSLFIALQFYYPLLASMPYKRGEILYTFAINSEIFMIFSAISIPLIVLALGETNLALVCAVFLVFELVMFYINVIFSAKHVIEIKNKQKFIVFSMLLAVQGGIVGGFSSGLLRGEKITFNIEVLLLLAAISAVALAILRYFAYKKVRAT